MPVTKAGPNIPPPAEAEDGLPQPRRFWAIVAIGLGLIMAVLTGNVASLALPAIARELVVSPAASVWVVNAYQLSVTMTLLAFAALGDIVSFRRVYLAGLVVFTIGSLACALADSLTTLVLARVLQGLGASAVMSVNSALIRFIYPRRLLGAGFGINAMIGSTTSALGPTVAAAILSVAPWQYLFALNVPFGIAGVLLGLRMLPPTPRASHRFDLGSAALNAVAFGLFIVGLSGLGSGSDRIAATFAIAAAGLAGWLLVRRQVARPTPLLPVDLLRRPTFALSVTASTFSFAAQGMMFVCMPFYFEEVLGRSQAETGLLMTPWPLTVAFVAPIAGRLSDRFSTALVGGCGQALMFIGTVALAVLPDDPSFWNIAWRMSLAGFGFGLFNSPNNRTIITSAPANRSGGASGMQATSRLMGQTIGTAIVGVLFSMLHVQGTIAALILGAAFCLIAGACSVKRTP